MMPDANTLQKGKVRMPESFVGVTMLRCVTLLAILWWKVARLWALTHVSGWRTFCVGFPETIIIGGTLHALLHDKWAKQAN